MLFGQDGADKADQGVPAGEDPRDVGPPADLPVQPLLYPALAVGASCWGCGWSAGEPVEVAGEGAGDAGVAGGFTVPAAGFGVGLQVLDVGELVLDRITEFGAGDEVVAGFADVGLRAGAGGLVA